MPRIPNRKLALDHYPPVCVLCGFGIAEILDAAHLDGNRQNNALTNLALLRPTCHHMHDVGLIPTEVIIQLRDVERKADWRMNLKDAGVKTARTRASNRAKASKRSAAAKKAHATRRKTRSDRQQQKRRGSRDGPSNKPAWGHPLSTWGTTGHCHSRPIFIT